ncbi:uncharacterized protein LOC111256495 [Setaria italica]|uniref:uncharacterized protein LOC111256495 n=1 Tax=Setaria italica TaxID=4555 RepID=UPI000BE4EA71|nr:uncharacterized protein LOC111256495 [Setaria italica]
METEVGGDELAQFTIPGRGKKRPPSPAAPPSDEGEDSPMSTTRDDDGWNISDSDSGCEEEKDNEGTDGPFTANNFPKFSSDHFEQTTTLYTYPRIYELFLLLALLVVEAAFEFKFLAVKRAKDFKFLTQTQPSQSK